MQLNVSSIAKSSTNKGRKMKDFVFFTFLVLAILFMFYDKPKDSELELLKEQEIQLKIKILQHELAAYEAMEQELKSE